MINLFIRYKSLQMSKYKIDRTGSAAYAALLVYMEVYKMIELRQKQFLAKLDALLDEYNVTDVLIRDVGHIRLYQQ